MLYILHRKNHPDLSYSEGQRPIVHLQADLHGVVSWAQEHGRLWAFSDRNAGTFIARFFNQLDELQQVNWTAVASTDFRDMVIKEGKQAEFLVHESFPWHLVERIGVADTGTAEQVRRVLVNAKHQPEVIVEPNWYY
jgi:hypothetical protein